jgi:hypothetical protein
MTGHRRVLVTCARADKRRSHDRGLEPAHRSGCGGRHAAPWPPAVQGDHRTHWDKHSEHVRQTSAVPIQPQEANREEGKQAAGEATRERDPEGPGANVAPAHETHSRCDPQQVPAGSAGNRVPSHHPSCTPRKLSGKPSRRPPRLSRTPSRRWSRMVMRSVSSCDCIVFNPACSRFYPATGHQISPVTALVTFASLGYVEALPAYPMLSTYHFAHHARG